MFGRFGLGSGLIHQLRRELRETFSQLARRIDELALLDRVIHGLVVIGEDTHHRHAEDILHLIFGEEGLFVHAVEHDGYARAEAQVP